MLQSHGIVVIVQDKTTAASPPEIFLSESMIIGTVYVYDVIEASYFNQFNDALKIKLDKLDYITLHYQHFKRHLHLKDQWCINNYMLYEIQPTGPARRLATQQVGYDQKGKSAVCSNTHNIISSMAPHEFNVVPRTTTDEFNVLNQDIWIRQRLGTTSGLEALNWSS